MTPSRSLVCVVGAALIFILLCGTPLALRKVFGKASVALQELPLPLGSSREEKRSALSGAIDLLLIFTGIVFVGTTRVRHFTVGNSVTPTGTSYFFSSQFHLCGPQWPVRLASTWP